MTRVPCATTVSVRAEEILSAMCPTRHGGDDPREQRHRTILPVEEVGAGVRDRGALLVVDAAQSAGVLPMDVQAMKIDYSRFRHKGLFVHQDGGLVLGERAKLSPIRQGGTGTRSEDEDQPPCFRRIRDRTLNSVGIAGLGAASALSRSKASIASTRTRALIQRLFDGPARDSRSDDLRACDYSCRVGVLSIRLGPLGTDGPGVALDQEFDIAVRTGCIASPLAHRTIGTLPTGTVRLRPDTLPRRKT